jgi:hypothetical protein
MNIEIEVAGPYPCWITLKGPGDEVISLRHTDLLAIEHAIAEAKRQVLCKLPRRDWHEVDPSLAGGEA